ncbi:LysR substrate-binding domain-containing protein [Variovorax sp. J31P207]|uniref:LysR substrate-binding domain-containing protein n=1 Tax=Variovorax sp. J31P207 TaxID=3053510 RepID=UPI002576E0D0|nr:LysR substrate-binding domain-containing protein [Variovorax sp. J31P207]MDM0071592.1 LysR substrate-binding domain-containing protein [Variovorax sp. J31P207]
MSRTRLPPLNALRAFDAVARHETVVRAADELNVTPSAVSHQLRILEESLGVQLFARHKARLKLTAHGNSLLPAVRTAFQQIANAAARIGDAVMVGDLVVSTPVGLTSRWLARHIRDFVQTYPDINLRLIASNDGKEVYSPKVDVCIRYGTGVWPDRSVSLLSHVEIFPVCSPAMISGANVKSVADLQSHPLLCEDDGSEWTRWLLASRSTRDGFRMVEMGNAHVAIEAAVHGQGLALADSLLVQDDLAKGRLVRLMQKSIPAQHSYHVVCRSEVRDMPLAAAFIAWVEHGIRTDDEAVQVR